MSEALQQIIEAVKQSSPFLWRAAYRYAVVDALTGLLFGVIVLGGMAWFMFHLTKRFEDSDAVALAWIGLVLSLVGVGGFIFYNAEQLLALDYYAVQALVGLVKH